MATRKGNGGSGWAQDSGGTWRQTKQNPEAKAAAEELLRQARDENADRIAKLASELPTDAELFRRVKAVLLDMAQHAGEPRDKIAASKALIDAMRPAWPGAGRGEDLSGLSPEALQKEIDEARATLAQ